MRACILRHKLAQGFTDVVSCGGIILAYLRQPFVSDQSPDEAARTLRLTSASCAHIYFFGHSIGATFDLLGGGKLGTLIEQLPWHFTSCC
mmetsp:Transcript_11631/g.22621  ORF Transcript_11631/g.22621 Transcript_11631/m.22621 type:complete len:90 (+) Transcript_11631:443-712(+)